MPTTVVATTVARGSEVRVLLLHERTMHASLTLDPPTGCTHTPRRFGGLATVRQNTCIDRDPKFQASPRHNHMAAVAQLTWRL